MARFQKERSRSYAPDGVIYSSMPAKKPKVATLRIVSAPASMPAKSAFGGNTTRASNEDIARAEVRHRMMYPERYGLTTADAKAMAADVEGAVRRHLAIVRGRPE